MRRLVVLVCLAASGLASCVTTLFPQQETLFWSPIDGTAVFALKDLTITTKPTTGNLKQTAADLAQMAARKAGLVLDPNADGTRFDLTISLEEREFGVDIETYNSVSVVMKVWTSEDARQVGQVVYEETTKNTLRAANYLDQVLTASFQQLAQKIPGTK